MTLDHPGLRRLRSMDVEERGVDQGYSLIRYQSPFTTTFVGRRERTKDQTFEAPGDHLHLLELTGAEAIAVSTATGAKGNPFLPMQEGDTLTRRFQKFTVRNLSDLSLRDAASSYAAQRVTSEALFLVSHGRVLERWRKPVGLSAGFLVTRLTATATGIDIFDAIRAAWGLVADDFGQPLGVRFGGTVQIHNLSAGVTIYVGYGGPGLFTPGGALATTFSEANTWEVLPGDRWEFYAEGRLATVKRSRGALSLGSNALCAAVSAGTADFKVLLPRIHVDSSDEDSRAPADRRGLES